ncbi:hypothetical protein OJ252_2730 [Cryptosporidium canis]|uniref:Mitochondrial inner membrane protease subunit n=1 Tax=Cryptosporidium canis TaxID=195482 RepID=A0ABQ8P4E2_9CRYT|nr:hypothetical protein OJ252_2730 [Cryptosporidium canis]
MPAKYIAKSGLKYVKILVGLHLFQRYGLSVCITDGPSMAPTIGPKRELLLYEKLSVSLSRVLGLNGRIPVHRNDIVIARSAEDPELIVCKRVLAEGDIVTVFPNFTLVSKPNEHNIRGLAARSPISLQVRIPPNYFWIQGDNFKNSRDSRNYGPIHGSMVIGRVLFKVSLDLGNFY